MAPRALVSPEHSLAIYWSPKAGCSTTAQIFLSLLGLYRDDGSVIEQRDEYCEKLLQEYVNNTTTEYRSLLCNQDDIFYKNYIKLQVVRNPYSRVVTSFLRYLELFIPKQLSFNQYLEGIQKGLILEHHMLPQFMTNQINHILHLENLEEDLAWFNEHYGYSIPYKKYPKESYNKIINLDISEYYGDKILSFTKNGLPFFINKNKVQYYIPSYKYFYNTYTKQLVENIYMKDISFFRYKFPYD